MYINMRFYNLLEGFRECASLSLPGTRQREGGRLIQGCQREQNEKMHISYFRICKMYLLLLYLIHLSTQT